jgi:hypothetical protein
MNGQVSLSHRRAGVHPAAVVTAGLAGTAALVAGVLVLVHYKTYDTWGALLVAPVLVLVTLPVLARQAAREEDRRLLWVLSAALVLKLCGAVARNYADAVFYQGSADSIGYHLHGVELAAHFWSGNLNTGLDGSSIQFMYFVTGVIYSVIGPTKLGGDVVFSWLGFLGLFCFYRAFTLAVPDGRWRGYARLVFFLPSLLFWPSGIGKDAWMMLVIGITAFGAARVVTGRTARGAAIAVAGLWLAALVRPHVAGIMALALATAALLAKPSAGWRQLALVAKLATLAIVAAIAVVVVTQAERFLEDSGVDLQGGRAAALNQVSSAAKYGQSSYTPPDWGTPDGALMAATTVLFRPFPTEARNPQAVVAALESSFLLLLTLVRWRSLVAAIRGLRRRPYLVLALVYTLLFVVAFAAVGNFGILVRQRSQVLPLYLVLLCCQPRASRSRTDRAP